MTKRKRACLTHQQSRTVMPSPPSWCSRAANTPQSKQSCPRPLSRLPTSRICFFFLSTRSAHTSSLSLQMQLDGERTEILIEVYDLRSGLILCQAASSVTPRLRISVYSFSHVSISPPDVGGMHQNSAAHLFSTSSSSSTLVSVSARRDHRARSAYGQKRKQLGRQASSLDFIISFSFFCCSAIHK